MNVLVFGGRGMVGSMLVRHLNERGHDVTFTVREKIPSWMPISRKVSLFKFDAFSKIPDLTGYDYVVNCIGAIKQKDFSDADTYYLNAVFPWKLASACIFYGVKMVHVSSDCVFSGTSAEPYAPSQKLDAEDAYGLSKAFGEPFGAIIVRTGLIGPSESGAGLFEEVKQNKVVSCAANSKWSGVTTLFLAQYIDGLITKPEMEIPASGGLIQIASHPITHLALMETINEVFAFGKIIGSYDSPNPQINRTLLSTVGYAPDIHSQLALLRDWMQRQ